MRRKDYKKMVTTKTNELIKMLATEMKKTCEHLYSSGALDVDKFNPDEYALAKILVTAAMRRHKDDFKPFTPEYNQDCDNLLHF